MSRPNQNLFVNGMRPDGARIDLEVEDGRIAKVTDDVRPYAESRNIIDLEGRLLLPALVDCHLHLDKTFLGMDWMPHDAGNSVQDRIDRELQVQSSIGGTVYERACRLVELAATKGTTALRTHVDVDEAKGLSHLREILRVRDHYSNLVDIQIVAFPQSGVVRQPGVAELLDHAVTEGADLLGGIDPATIDGDLDGQLDCLYEIAIRRNVGLDIHLHSPGQAGAEEIEAIAVRTKAVGLEGRVTVSHAYCLGSIDADQARQISEKLAMAGISIVTACPGPVPFPPLNILRDAGVRILAGSDNVRDAWTPFGNADMLERLMLMAYRCGYRRDQEIESTLDFVTTDAAVALGFEAHGLEIGQRADFIAVAARNPIEAIAVRPPQRLVFKAGRLIARDGHFGDA